MADNPQPKDSLGRQLQVDVAAIRQLLSKNDMGSAIPHGSKKDTKEVVEKISKIIGGDFAKNLKSATENLKNITSKLTKKKPKEQKDSCCEKLLQAIKGLGKLDSSLQNIVKQQEKTVEVTENLAKNINKNSGGGSGGSSGSGGNSFGGTSGNFGKRILDKAKKNYKEIMAWAEDTSAKLMGGYSVTSRLMDGIIDKNLEFSNELKRTAWRVQGVTGEMSGLQDQWIDMADNWGDFQKLTGQSASNMQDAFMRISKKGLLRNQKDIQKVNKLMIASGSAATQLGTKIEATSELFGDWSQYLGMSEVQIGRVAAQMKVIQSETGISGDDMVQIAKSSETMLKNLRKYGNLTAENTSALIGLMAQAKQLDISEEMNELLKPLNSMSDFLSAEGPYKNALIYFSQQVPGLTEKLLNGTFAKDLKTNTKELVKGQEQAINSILAQINPGATLENFEDTIPEEMRGQIDHIIKSITGMTLDQNARMKEALVEGNKTFAEKLADINEQRIAAGKSSDEASLMLVQSLNEQEKTLRKTEAMSAIANISDKYKKKGLTKNASESLSNIGITGGTDEEKIKTFFIKQAQELKAAGITSKDASGKEIDLESMVSSANYNNKDVVDMLAKQLESGMQEAMQKQNTSKAKETNAMDNLANDIQSLNAKLTTLVSPLLAALPVALGYTVASVGALTTAINSLLTFKGLFGGGGGGGGGGFPTMPIPGNRNATPASSWPQGTMTTQGRGRGKFGKLLSFLPAATGAIAGAYGGYKASQAMDKDGENDWTEWLSAAGGGLAGGFAGRKIGKSMTNKSAAGGAADVAGSVGDAMSGMPGFGGNCVPVCIVGGLENMTSGLSSGIMNGLSVADTAGDVASMMKKGDDVADAAKGGSWLGKAWGKVKGAASSVSNVAGSAWNATGGKVISGAAHYGGKAIAGAKHYGGKAIDYGMKKFNSLKEALPSVKGIFSGPIAQGIMKALGPILTIVSSVGNAMSVISGAKAAQAAGQSVDVGAVGKSIFQAGAYPIANSLTNLIPGIGTAISAADGILGAFGMSPIQWLSDNLIDLIPNNAFSGLGSMALGEPQAQLAVGGIVTKPTHALIGEAGPEAVLPLNKMNNFMNQIFQGANLSKLFGIENLKGNVNNVVASVSKPINDMYNRVREQYASRTAGISRSAELEKLDEVSEKQLERLVSIDENIKELVSVMTRSKPTVPQSQSKIHKARETKPAHSPEWGYWPAHMTAAGLGNIQISSDGVNI